MVRVISHLMLDFLLWLLHCSGHCQRKKYCCIIFAASLPEESAMKMHEFTHLSLHKKAALLYKEGVYIGKRKRGQLVVLLYQVEGFYAEVSYRTYRREIDRISCFSGTRRLDPYLAGINVKHLVT
jgi:hypothetical protein